MSVFEPRCSIRHCVHLQGVTWLGSEEESEVNFCSAFPDGIPDEIAYGDNKHLEPLPDQDNDIVFEKADSV